MEKASTYQVKRHDENLPHYAVSLKADSSIDKDRHRAFQLAGYSIVKTICSMPHWTHLLSESLSGSLPFRSAERHEKHVSPTWDNDIDHTMHKGHAIAWELPPISVRTCACASGWRGGM